ncbi:TetR/AcrR family transcriptional regulator [Nonomuraea sp. NPDC049129]|uniref:TetR/AcrR family transcriptional regulator n=1 Tax=Nonomuraea sp. NPDC049129 TaxID=3155272 RepID=UPI0033F8595D
MPPAAQRHFLDYGVGTSLEAVAKEAGVGPGTLYRHFPTREALLAAVLQTRSEELVARQADIAQLGDASEALRQWLRAMEDYFSAFSGLPEPLMAAARAQERGLVPGTRCSSRDRAVSRCSPCSWPAPREPA